MHHLYKYEAKANRGRRLIWTFPLRPQNLWFIFIGLSLLCYKCTSTDKETCRKWQQEEECNKIMLHPFCLTMKYMKRRMVNGRSIDEHTYAMRCARSDFGCGHHCNMETMMGAVSCQVSHNEKFVRLNLFHKPILCPVCSGRPKDVQGTFKSCPTV